MRRLARLAFALSLVSLASVSGSRAVADELDVECDATAAGEVPIERLPQPQPSIEAAVATQTTAAPAVEEIAWRPSEGRQCTTYHGRRMCDGPRRVPVAQGPASELAGRLGLDEHRVAHTALEGIPPRQWVEATEGEMGAGLLWPVESGRFWRGFGRHREILRAGAQHRLIRGRRQIQHPGVDIGAPEGSPIRAANDGLVLYSFNGMRGYGNAVIILHPDSTVALYAHCRATYVFAGQQVRRGQTIAEVGDTGLAHGAHLHFEWHHNGRPMDPLAHFVGGPDDR